jgi:hypothetical protein
LNHQKAVKQEKAGKPVITYVSRQEWGRRMLLPKGHDSLVHELKQLEKKYGWEASLLWYCFRYEADKRSISFPWTNSHETSKSD